MSNFKFKVVLTPITEVGFEGSFMATVPSLPGIVTQGKNKDEALKMAHEAITLHLEDMIENNEDIPSDFTDAVELDIKIA